MSDISIAEQLDGVWVMEKISTIFVDQPPEIHQDASGQLIYDRKLGTVFAHIVRPDDKSDTGELRFEYAGHFDLDADKGEVTHHIEWATTPKMVGKDMKRQFNLSADGKNLAITGPSAEYKDAQIQIDWVKLGR